MGEPLLPASRPIVCKVVQGGVSTWEAEPRPPIVIFDSPLWRFLVEAVGAVECMEFRLPALQSEHIKCDSLLFLSIASCQQHYGSGRATVGRVHMFTADNAVD